MKNLELKFYEKIGVKKFKNYLIKFVYLLSIPISILLKIPKEKRKKNFYNTPTNYTMKKGNGLKDLKDFKKCLYFNSCVHIYALIPCIMGLLTGSFIIEIPCIILNLYCIMLQRYNYIRIDNTIKKFEKIEQNKINNIKDEIKENIESSYANISIYTYKKKINKEDKTLDNMLNNLSLKNLKKLKKIVEEYQKYNNKYLYATFEEKNKKYQINTRIKQKRI